MTMPPTPCTPRATSARPRPGRELHAAGPTCSPCSCACVGPRPWQPPARAAAINSVITITFRPRMPVVASRRSVPSRSLEYSLGTAGATLALRTMRRRRSRVEASHGLATGVASCPGPPLRPGRVEAALLVPLCCCLVGDSPILHVMWPGSRLAMAAIPAWATLTMPWPPRSRAYCWPLRDTSACAQGAAPVRRGRTAGTSAQAASPRGPHPGRTLVARVRLSAPPCPVLPLVAEGGRMPAAGRAHGDGGRGRRRRSHTTTMRRTRRAITVMTKDIRRMRARRTGAHVASLESCGS